MTHADFIRELANRLGQTQVETRRIWNASMETVKSVLDKDVSVSIPGLGSFQTALLNKRRSYSPYHQSPVLLPRKRVVKFHGFGSLKSKFKHKRI